MFFERIGRFTVRFRALVLITWIALAAIITLVAPDINQVASSDTTDFLPANAPFQHAQDLVHATFPQESSKGGTVVVIDARDAPNGILDTSATDFAAQIDTEAGRFITDFADWLRGSDAPSTIQQVDAPTDSATLAALLIASDASVDPSLANHIALVRIEFSITPSEPQSAKAMDTIDAWLAEHRPADVQTYQTGTSPIVRVTSESATRSAKRSIRVTVVLVVAMLLLVYRSPVSPLIPLTAVTIAYLITRGIVAFLGEHVMTITSYVDILLVAVMYGAGTDYCLFLISRFREEMADHTGLLDATTHTVHRVGETISSSAGTIFVGFMAMAFAEMGLFKTSGPSLAIGIVVSLLSGLTLVPALLSLLGDHIFWPFPAHHRANGRLYEVTSKWVSSRPLTVIVIIVAIMAPLSIYGVTRTVNYDMLTDLPKDKDVVVGFDLIKDSLGAGSATPLTVVVTGRDPQTIASDIVTLTNQIAALNGVYDVRGMNDPLGLHAAQYTDLLHVSTQLQLAQSMFQGDAAATSLSDPTALAAALDGVKSYLNELATTFPEVADDSNLATLRDLVDNPLKLISQRDAATQALAGLSARFETMPDAVLLPTALSDVLSALSTQDSTQDSASASSSFAQLTSTYLADGNTAFKLDIVLSNYPSSAQGMQTLTAIRKVLRPYQTSSGDAVVSGMAAISTDLRDTMDRDLLRAIGFVLAGIFIVLLLMLRSMVAPLYLIGTVLLSFTFTLGLTNLVFQTVKNVNGLTWYVPFFAFVFLVALGIDYSIFLFGRIKEEVGYHGIREGVHTAVATTGAIITSAGMILAGTFAALMTAEVAGLMELGFAVAVGVLIDTFVVRTVLDPALATLFGRWTWWPGGVPRATQPRSQQTPVPDSGD